MGETNDGTLSHATLAKLSGLGATQIDDFMRTWRTLATEERRRLAQRLADLAQDNVELDYNDIFRRLLDDDDAEIRVAAIDGLWEDDRASTAERLLEIARADPEERVRLIAFDALGRIANRIALDDVHPRLAERVRGVLREHLGARHPIAIRRRALEASGYLPDETVQQAIRAAYASDDLGLRTSAVRAMGRQAEPVWLPIILRELSNPEPEMRFEAARAAGEIEDQQAVPALIEALADDDADVRRGAIEALGAIGGRQARQALLHVRDGDDEAMSDAATDALDELEISSDPLGVRAADVHPN